jgi:hypothetical protein
MAPQVSVPDTDWQNPQGNDRHQSRPPKSTQFQENTACSGVDDTDDPTWIMVPMSGSNSGAKVHIRGNTQDVKFVSEDPTIATVTPAAPTGKNTPITVSGLKSGQITTIDARSISDPTHNYAQLKVVVKPQITKTVDMVRDIDPVNNLTPQTVPTAAALLTYLNQIWGTQSNTLFTLMDPKVAYPRDVSVHYDILPTPNGDQKLNDFHATGSSQAESVAIIQVAKPPSTATQLQANYVNSFGPPINSSWAAGYFLEGLSLTGAGVSFIEDTPPGPGPFNSRVNISAHELGHAAGALDLDAGTPQHPANVQLMYRGRSSNSDPLNPCEVRRCDWSLMNPTQGLDDGKVGTGCSADRLGHK